ncbi:relaxase/mobilization nuclease domain-containing protein [Dyadobacter sp. CY323]|uniref:relaxase/mobilization nuclease domain-containing protein n=1 Tax=Dyadobacter sp. CY323 TaxID=2907302 RepID=UPI001F384FD0|nr:hypothetical protein [Dyadobacter sp. CY323]MCE6989016.1 hypothetical protein [Dyadobacter sp. CY323]
MVIRGKSRGNGKQLAAYLLAKRDNDIQPLVLQTRGFADIDPVASLVNTSLDVALLSKSTKPFYHCILNPRKNEALDMSQDDWEQAANILEKWMQFDELPRLMVLHTKNGRTHLHVVWSRFDYQTSKLRADKYNYYKHNSARADLEIKFDHNRTSLKRNKDLEPWHKEQLTNLWKLTDNASDFVASAKASGYEIGQGLDRRPYRAITPEGKSIDLIRNLEGYKKRDFEARFNGYVLPTEAAALRMHHQRFGTYIEILPEQKNTQSVFESLQKQLDEMKQQRRNRQMEY